MSAFSLAGEFADLMTAAARSRIEVRARMSVARFVRYALLSTFAGLCAAAAFACALVALAMFTAASLGPAGATLVDAAILALTALAAYGFGRRDRSPGPSPPAPSIAPDPLLAQASAALGQQTAVPLIAALLVGIILGSRKKT